MYNRIITHQDFDGVVSAVLCSHAFQTNQIVFTQPRVVQDARISITDDDIVCDLPYPLECGMWFDHHEGNLEDLQFRKIDPATLEGRFQVRDSCARVIYEYLQDQQMPDFFAEMVKEADIIDAFNYKNIEDWRAETPGKMIDAAIKVTDNSQDQKRQFLRSLVQLLKERPIDQVALTPGVTKRYKLFQQVEEEMLELIGENISFLPQDEDKKLIIIDLTRHAKRTFIYKNLACLIEPDAQAVIQVSSLYQNQVKTNDLSFSMSLSVNMNQAEHHKDIGEIMRLLNIGNGHPGAAAGSVYCDSKAEMLKQKEQVLNEIYRLFTEQ